MMDERRPGEIPPGTLCANCKNHEATVSWVGQGSVLDFVHGNWTPWCECCAIEAELQHAEKQAKKIPSLRTKLDALRIQGAGACARPRLDFYDS